MAEAPIHSRNLRFRYPLQDSWVLDALSFHIVAGESVLVAGRSGSGKSTLLRTLNGLVPHFTGGRLSGELWVAGCSPVANGPRGMSNHVGFVQQDADAQFVVDTVEDELAFGMENQALSAQLMADRIEDILSKLGLLHLRHRHIHSLSGGEKQRVAIAAAVAVRPPILVLDEPTSQLDPQSAEDVLEAVRHLNQSLGMTTIVSEHRLERVLPYAGRLFFLPGPGAPALAGTPQEILAQMPFAPPLARLGRELGWDPVPLTVEQARPLAAGLNLRPRSRPGPGTSGSVCARVDKVHYAYGDVPALGGVSLCLREGQVMALMGRNGSGKSTLLRLLVGLLSPRQGRITINGLDTQQSELSQIIAEVGYVPQDPASLLFADTVRQELAFTCQAHHLPPAAVERYLDILGLAALAERYPRELSVGERQRVAVAAILVAEPRIVLLDEPTRGMDWLEKESLARQLRGLAAQGRSVVIATHDVELVAECADRMVILEKGEVAADGSVREVMRQAPMFASQVYRLFGNTRMITVRDVLQAVGAQ